MTTAPVKLSRYARRVLDLAADDPQLQELMPDEAVLAAVTAKGQTVEGIVTAILTGYGDRPALGERSYDVVADPESGRQVRRYRPEFTTITYAELRQRVEAIAAAWRQSPEHGARPGEFVCFLGFAGTDYVSVDLATVLTRTVAVPLQTSLASADLERIVADTAPSVIAATVTDLVAAAALATRHPSVRSVIALDLDERVDADLDSWAEAEAELARGASPAKLVRLPALVAAGSQVPWRPIDAPAGDGQQIALLIHSSGSTGTPKGAIITERHARFQFTAVPPTAVPTVRLCFAPMNHFMGRGAVYNTMGRGGTVFFTASPDMSTLFEDFRLVRPTEAVMFPRVLEMIHRHFLAEAARRLPREGGDVDAVRQQVKDEMRYTFLGNRISSIFGGSAPTTPEIRQFISDCFPATYAEGYGTTEAGGSVTVRDRINRAEVLDFRLQDVPELGYYATDKPYPRGELCVRTRLAIPGYFKNPEATAKLFDEDGFVRTGDIMEQRGPDHLVYLDRRNDVLKLAHGEFITLGAVGNTFETHSDVIRQIFVYGNPARAFLLAVVVPDPALVELRLGADPTEAQVKDLIRSELARVAQAHGLRSFELPRDVIVENEPFSQQNGLLSSVSKRLRPRLLDRYGARLEALYEQLESKQNADLMALRDPDSGLGVLERVGRALAATLSIDSIDPTEPRSFAEFGGDSLGAAAFAALLSDIFDVAVDVNSILSPAGNPPAWAAAITRALRSSHDQRPTAASVHGPAPRHLAARDLEIARLLPRVLDTASGLRPAATSTRTVLLTGATGFLGRFLCLEWLEQVAPLGGTVFCLVRGRDAADARARLRAAYAGDDELSARFASNERHLEVLVGDVAEDRLGLDEETYGRLVGEVDRIVHCGALVNHVLEYEDLFGPNVLGTAELVALALDTRLKHIDFVSSLAVVPYLDRSVGLGEDSPLRAKIAVSDRYSAHYGASKWAAEAVLLDAHERYGVPVAIFRGDMMLPHRRYRGQVNVPDVFVRLLQSIVLTGLAPRSFYELSANGDRARAHYDGLPVDFIASALVAIAAAPDSSPGVRTFHVINPHDDGISLDSIVDWASSAGHPIDRVASYAEWLVRFRRALEELPDDQRQRSSLSVIESLQRPSPAVPTVAGSDGFTDAVRRACPESQIPHLSEQYVAKCLDDLVGLGLVKAPVPVGAGSPG